MPIFGVLDALAKIAVDVAVRDADARKRAEMAVDAGFAVAAAAAGDEASALALTIKLAGEIAKEAAPAASPTIDVVTNVAGTATGNLGDSAGKLTTEYARACATSASAAVAGGAVGFACSGTKGLAIGADLGANAGNLKTKVLDEQAWLKLGGRAAAVGGGAAAAAVIPGCSGERVSFASGLALDLVTLDNAKLAQRAAEITAAAALTTEDRSFFEANRLTRAIGEGVTAIREDQVAGTVKLAGVAARTTVEETIGARAREVQRRAELELASKPHSTAEIAHWRQQVGAVETTHSDGRKLTSAGDQLASLVAALRKNER